jgi:hypothetical protein
VSDSKYLVGIDLGTSNCAVAFLEPARGPDAPVLDFAVPQLVQLGEVASRPLLPSCIYLPSPHEFPSAATRLPWPEQPDSTGGAGEGAPVEPGRIAGEFARWQGARVPGRLVTSAKSWLCHPGVDRAAPILPWGAGEDVARLSPVDASAELLSHLAGAWDSIHPDAPMAAQEVVITVPASFDEVARSLTVSAARKAGLVKFTLVEEPQAAFYDFTSRHRGELARILEGTRLVLVVDVGGGTTDLTLIQVGVSAEGPVLRRIAVGEHLMLGGDNMDSTLARNAEERMLAGGRRLSATQWSQLLQAARVAKESLLGEQGPGQYKLSVAAEGSRLIGGALSAQITRAEAERVILDGFLPGCGPGEAPRRGGRMALQELGLPYAHDPAITRHIAAFLRNHAAAGFAALGEEGGRGALPRPDALLLNGGVFNSRRMVDRLIEVMSAWWPGSPRIPLLHHDSLELAVARGAAVYGLARRGMGRRIAGGAAHALYVGLEKAGEETPMALCVVPRGREEGEEVDLGGRAFHLALGRPVKFPLFSTAADRLEKSGDVVPVSEDMRPLPPIHTVLKGAGDKQGRAPVHLRANLTEIGTLELWCVANDSNQRWRLEFELRGSEPRTAPTVTESMPAAFGEARRWVGLIFGAKPKPLTDAKGIPPKDVRQLWAALERTLGPREDWGLPVLRELWSALLAGAVKRRRSSDHERICFQLIGFSLRPGFGYPLDEWRCDQTFHLFPESVQFHKEKAVWNEFWILWRRISGGLNEARHREIWSVLKPHLAARIPPRPPKHIQRPKGPQPEGLDEMARLAAGLEHLEAAEKTELGDWISLRLEDPATAAGPWTWALGRLGARTPIYGSSHRTVPPGKAWEWIELLLRPHIVQLEGALFALVQLARLTGDRSRDLDEDQRKVVLEALQKAGVPPTWERMLRQVVALESADRVRAFGDTLPVGLTMA